MKLEMQGQMRLEQKMKLAPRMIQSMEILQLPIFALQERIEQELNSNPVLEKEEQNPVEVDPEQINNEPDYKSSDDDLENFNRIESLDDGFRDYMDQANSFRPRYHDQEDHKLEAIKNTAASQVSLNEYLKDQWLLMEVEPAIARAGETIIDYIDDRGFLSVRLEQLHNKDKDDYNFDDLKKALKLVQQLDPAGVGARDLKECLLIQMRQSAEDMSFECQLIENHMSLLLENKLPDIARKMNATLDQVNLAIKRMSKFDTSPGLQISKTDNHAVCADVIVTYNEDEDDFIISLADSSLPALRVNDYYAQVAGSSETEEKIKKFLQTNIRSAQWIIEAIEQRKNTLLKVTRSIVKHQREFFEQGQLHLRPLPMSVVADEVGVHVATVSRAVSGKYVQCDWAILPLRKFFSGGMEDSSGESYSWEAIRGVLQNIIAQEDKSKPLSDDQIRKKLAAEEFPNIARRTVAKYRKLCNIPPARLRKKF